MKNSSIPLRIAVLFAFMLSGIHISNAQNHIVKGILVDKNTKAPLEFASVVLYSSKDSVFIKGELTDSAGAFIFKEINTGSYFIKLLCIGYQHKTTPSFAFEDSQTEINMGQFSLGKDVTQLNEVTITAEKPAFERQFDKIILNVSSSNVYKTATTAIDVLKRAPGIRVDAEGGILLRNNVRPTVLIDGKPIPMSADELTNYLNTLGQEQIESVEVIDNPSSKYDGEYKGIINIKLKRDKNLGWKGTLSGFVLQNTYTGAGGVLNTGYRTKKFNFFGMLGYSKDKSMHLGYGKQYLNSDTYLLKLTADEYRERDKNSLQLGTDYFITPKQNISLIVSGYNNRGKRNGFMDNKLSTGEEGVLLSMIIANNKQKRRFENYSLNANYDGDFGKDHLSINLSGADFKTGQDQYITNKGNLYVTEQIRSLNYSTIELAAGQVDYSHTFSKFIWEMGAKTASTNTSNNLQYDTLSVSNNWNADLGRTNRFSYQETIFAGYVNASTSFGKKWNLQLGLRAENTQSDGYSETTNTHVRRNYVKLLPSLVAGYRLNENNSLDLSYSRRLERPSFDLLNPFRTYNGPYGYTEGNPFLIPVTTNFISLNYTYKRLSTGIEYTYLEDKITQLAHVEDNITGYTIVNFNDVTYLGWKLNYPLTVTKWWNMQNTVAAYYVDQNVVYMDTTVPVKNISCFLEGSQIFNFLKAYTAELNYMYYSKSKEDIYSMSDIYRIGVSFQKGFFQNKLDIKLNFEDVFYSQYTVNAANIGNYHAENYEKHDTRYVKLNVLYKFGKSEYNRKLKRSSAEEEQNRVN